MRPGTPMAMCLAAALTAGCGSASDPPTSRLESPTASPSSNSATTSTLPIGTASSSLPRSPATEATNELAPATVSTPAERLDEAVEITWIGGSEVQLEDRSLVDAVAARLPMIGGRPLELVGDTSIGPLPGFIEERVKAAAERNVDGLIVSLNPSWVTAGPDRDCSGVTPHHTFYACILAAPEEAEAMQLRSDIATAIAAVVDSGIPAYLYVMPHSAESMNHPELVDALIDAEAVLASLDPDLGHIAYVGRYLSRDLPDLHEGVEFNDMVHPSQLGVEVLADHLTSEFVQFWPGVLS